MSSLDCQFISITIFLCFFESSYLIIYKTSKKPYQVLSISQLQQLRDVLICCRYDISKPPFPRLSILNETRGLRIKSEKLSIGVFKISEISGRCLWVPIAALAEEVSRTPRYPFSGVRTEAAG
jgi:hypothetical protein